MFSIFDTIELGLLTFELKFQVKLVLVGVSISALGNIN
jgi:hypothetical protein